MKKVVVSVINDLSTDQRVHKVCQTLQENGFDVLLVGRELPGSLPLKSRTYATHRMKLMFGKGPLFYAEYNIRLFFSLLFQRVDVLLSNDLDTLTANYLAAKIKGKKLVFDSHEYFTGVPELEGRPTVKSVWKSLEKWLVPKLKWAYTVNASIAKLYQDEYGKNFKVIRNVPKRSVQEDLEKQLKSRRELGLPEDKKIIVLQGAGINVDRGAEEAVQAMRHVENALFLIIGSGDVIEDLKELSQQEDIKGKVQFTGRLPYEEMLQYTRNADLGITLDKDTNLNYRFSLPNKIFDYIHSGIPVLASRLPEIEKVVKEYEVGEIVESHDPKAIANKMNEMLSDEDRQKQWRKNAEKAAAELCWEKEKETLVKLFEEVGR